MPAINLVTALPGPRSQELQARKREHVTASLGQTVPLGVQSALGSLITDVDGKPSST